MVIAPRFSELQSPRQPFKETRNIYDRFIELHRFVWLQSVKTGIRINSAQAEEIPVKGKAKVRIEAERLRRGFTKFGTTAILYPDLLGMNYGVKRFVNPEQLLIPPKRYRINEAFELPGGSSAIPGGTSANWSSSTSDEFVSLRNYPEGDSAKIIHWPSSVKSLSSDQLPAENCYFHPVFQYFRASIARQSRTAAAVAPASHGLETIFELCPPNVLPI